MANITPSALRELRTALAAFDRAKEWEWSDLIKWLELVKSIIESFPNFDFEDPEKYLLYKRLAQCLNPNLPPGLHYNTLRIYESMLIKIFSTEQSMSDNIPMISAGIFPFFEYASPQTKPLVIDLIQTYYLKLGPQLTLCLSGMVSSLLTGLEDLTDIEVSNKLFKLLDDIAGMGPKPLFTAVWQALLKSPRAKIGALTFLNKRLQKLDKKESDFIPSKELVVNALIAGLRDPEVLIKRPTLDVIKSFFPLDCPILTNVYQSRLMSEVLELLAGKDFTINRRVWEWLGLHDSSTDIVAVVDKMTSSLMGFFERQQESEVEAIIPIGIIESLLDQPELTDILLEAFTSHILEYVNRFRDKYGKLVERLKSLLNSHSEKLEIVWGHLTSKLEDQMNTFDLDKTLIAIELMLSLKLDTPQDQYLHPVLENILGSMEDCNKKDRVKAQRLVLNILPELAVNCDLQSSASSYEQFLANLLQELAQQEVQVSDDFSPVSDLRLSLEVYIQLQQYSHFESQLDWIRLLLQVVASPNIECALVAALFVLRFVSTSSPMFESFQAETDGELTHKMVSRLWELCQGPSHIQAAELIIKYFEVYQTAVGDMIREWLSAADVEWLGENMKRFTVLWKAAHRLSKLKEEKGKDYVMLFFGTGVGIHEAIQALEHSSPRIRHLSKEWLMNSLARLDVVIHSVLPLSPLPKEEAITRKAIQQLRVMIENGGEMFIGKLRSEIILQPIEHIEKGPDKLKPSYYNTLLSQIVLKVFMKEGQDGAVVHDSNQLQFDACTVVKQLLNWGDPEAATELSPYLLWKLVRVVERKDLVLQYQLIEVMQIIIFKSRLKPDQLRTVIGSADFLKVIVLGLSAESQSALAFWIRLLSEFLRLALSLLDAGSSCKLFMDLMAKLGSVMQDYRDLTLIDTYVSLLHIALEMYSPSAFAKHKPFGSYFAGTYPELSNLNRHPNVAALLSTLVAGVEPAGMHSTYKLIIAVFKEAREMLAKWPSSTSSLPIKCSVAPSAYEPVIRALDPLAKEFPGELTAICVKAWLALFEATGSAVDSEKWKILQIYLDLKLRGEKILSSLEKFLRELNLKKFGRKNVETVVEIRICDLLNSLFSSQCFAGADSLEAWKLLLRICDILNYSNSSECPLWTAELLVSAHRAIPFEPCYIDKKVVKEVQQRVQHLIQHIISICTSQSNRTIDICPPSATAVVLKEDSLHICALLTLKSCLVDLVQLGWNSEYEQVAQLRSLTTPLLQTILEGRSTLQDDMATDLISELVNRCSPEFAQYIKRDIIDFFATDEFWNKLRSVKFDFNHWRRLLGLLVKKCFEDRLTIVQEIIKKLNVGFFTSKSSEIQQRAKILRCLALLIYSGERDEYQHVADDLTKKIIEELKVHEGALIPLIFLLCRVLIVKLEPPTLAEIWPRLWPHLFVDLVRIFSEEVAPMHQLSAIKLLELLYLIGNEDFQFASWVFFGTSQRPKVALEFTPCIEKLFQLPDQQSDLQEVRDSQKRPLEVAHTAAESTEELRESVHRLLAAVMQDSSTAVVADWDSVHQVLETDILNLEVI